MADASRLATGQYLLDGSFVPVGITTPEGFDGGGPPTFGGCSPARGPRFFLCGEVQHDVGALCVFGNRASGVPL